MGNLPFSFCESKETRQYTKLNPISEETLTAIMEAVTNAVENAIGYEMPESFGLIIDGWTHVSAVVAGFCGGGTRRSPERREPPQSYQEVFTLFRHRLNLAVRDFLQPSESDLEEVQQLMRKLRTLNQAVKLRAKTPLRAVLRQDTRWASTFSMLKRYFRLREFISADDDEGLQVEGFTLLHGRDLFDCLIEIRPSFSKYLAPDADIVHSPEFEQAVVKLVVVGTATPGLYLALPELSKSVRNPRISSDESVPVVLPLLDAMRAVSSEALDTISVCYDCHMSASPTLRQMLRPALLL
ncbi:hypothetical protein PC129_g14323 [Phytophthora cactorum]|uniref:Uncharacterized protein n=1 Tax=Phytophthora cactorum TaxID=29920 RepID=A0A8T1CDC8_9STRA|nr:hypothetical protein PC113_g15485 [Phytophthora cactorum]KAG2891974.1 hypothetical protein PC114_g16778 [Phytophthora cactorum]KAG2921035.1 hypothetical protein PC117_g16361 [Phytophthora cactorum]KAG2937480.1 hypothetical protein PC115_g4202 [Phytophthora cactorum]KAG3148851.1 hypothetical protein C6341_g17244 [Phytophthora cactorum]